jgi:hypothetical protein
MNKERLSMPKAVPVITTPTRPGILFAAVAATMTGLARSTAAAAPTTNADADSGVWNAFRTTSVTGIRICGAMTTWPGSGRVLFLKYFEGEGNVTVQIFKPSWDIPQGTEMRVNFQLGSAAPWTAVAKGSKDHLDFLVGGNKFFEFMTEFRFATTMAIAFPSGTEPTWQANLTGSNAAAIAMSECIAQMSHPTQPYMSQRPAPAAPSQPFGIPVTPPPGLPAAPVRQQTPLQGTEA